MESILYDNEEIDIAIKFYSSNGDIILNGKKFYGSYNEEIINQISKYLSDLYKIIQNDQIYYKIFLELKMYN